MAFYCTKFSVDKDNVLPSGKAASALACGDPVYLTSSGTWALALAVAAGTVDASRTNAMGVMTADCLIYETVSPVKVAFFQKSAAHSIAIGSPVYLTQTGTTGNGLTGTNPGIAYSRQILGYAISATEIMISINTIIGADCSKGITIASGTHVSTNTSLQTITVPGCLTTDYPFLTVISIGATPVTLKDANTATAGFIVANMSAAAGVDHKLAYMVVRPRS